jgi:hypothetical protein
MAASSDNSFIQGNTRKLVSDQAVVEVDAGSASSPSPPESLETPPKSSWWRRLVGLVWDSVEGDARNRRYVQKLDLYLL